MNIPIVVAAYNRKKCLERLLQSLNQSFYPSDVKLIISVDGGGTQDVVNLVNSFDWKRGDKEIISHKVNLGLRKHILSCGRLSKKYDGIILLEDDLYVAPHFYDYVLKTQRFYAHDENISGVALYSHKYNETACLPFTPIEDGYDVYFMQLACSWGQCWLSSQWDKFERWYEKGSKLDLTKDTSLPPDILRWPKTSWKKYFIKYMIENNKFFVYPRISYTTNFGDAGQHHKGTKVFQVPLQYSKMDLLLTELEKSSVKYDSFCEILPGCLKQYAPDLIEYDFAVDLYGCKRINTLKTDLVLTKQYCSHFIRSFACELKPHEVNIIENIKGPNFFLTQTQNLPDYGDFFAYRRRIISDYEKTHSYFYAITYSHYQRPDKRIKRFLYSKVNIENQPAPNIENMAGLTDYINSQEQRIMELEESYSYRIGYLLFNPIRMVRKFLKKFLTK